jgi:hypothetical protein
VHQVDLGGGAGHPGHGGAERLGQLHRERPQPTSRPDDQDPLARLDLAHIAEPLEGGEPREHYEFPDSVREGYLSAYDGDRFVESMRYVRADPTELPILAELLPQIETLVEIIGRLRDWGTEQP